MTPHGKALVVDASVVLKWIIDETGSDAALALKGHDMVAPAILRLETANVLRTLCQRGAVTQRQARDLFDLLVSAPVTIIDQDTVLETRALDLALELDHPVYDCIYLALAERTGRTLVTADARFARKAAATRYSDMVETLLVE